MASEQAKKTAISLLNKSKASYERDGKPKLQYVKALLELCRAIKFEEKDIEYAVKLAKHTYGVLTYPREPNEKLDALLWSVLLFMAPYDFDSYCLYLEKNRPEDKKFYQPRRQTFIKHGLIQALQDLEDDKLDFLGVSLPPRIGKSTICIFFMSWAMGRNPNKANLMSGYGDQLTKGFYSEIFNLITSSEYCFNEIFPTVKFESKSAEDEAINLNDKSRFPTITCRSVDGATTGAVEAENYLYCDDLIKDRKESLSPKRLEAKYQDYLNVLFDRKLNFCKELMVGTRWNLLDPLGRVEKDNKDNPRYRFLKIPALDENDHSNFKYGGHPKGFSDEYYINVQKRLDKNEWMAKYQQAPFKREGILFPEEDLRTYNGVLPEGGKMVSAACDVAWGGEDSLSMPIGVEFGGTDDIYIPDWVFCNGNKYTTWPLVVGSIVKNGVSRAQFEANNGGDEYEREVQKELREQFYTCNTWSLRALDNMSKMSKIIQYGADIMRRCVFLAPEYRSKMYQDAIDELCMFTQMGKNDHDDAPDGLTQLMMLISGGMLAQCTAFKRPC